MISILDLYKCPPDPTAEDLVDTLESVRVLQPSQGSRSHHRYVLVPATVSLDLIHT